ncbi:MAG: metalloregulator ArsR/SmtB family transcription factor [Desulfobulbaceae bacterium]|nr:MAG: metalloregulator ArsR/SmtB family transcription factor [Desulfobulbaceae bacterium]
MQTHVNVLKSMADETRLRLLLLLKEHGELCVCDLMHALAMPQSTVSRHLAYLRRNGWLQDRRGGVWMYYSLAAALPPFLRGQLELIGRELGHRQACMADRQRLAAWLQAKDRPCGE